MGNLERVSRFTSDLATRGLLYAIAQDRIHSPIPLDPKENWAFWAQPQPSLMKWFARAYPPSPIRKAFLDSMLEQDHASGIESHYDVSNDFYALFLDNQYRFYSAADFLHEQDTLEDAQHNKAMYLRSLLRLQGNEKILDLGCGWGAMLKLLRDQGHSGELTGFTLSKEQLAYVQELGFNVSLTNFITTPFEHKPFDRILSIGALEHVRPDEVEIIHQKIYAALAPGGLAVHQFFSLEYEPYPASMVMIQLFFPGSLLVMHPVHIEAAKQAGFHITHDSIHDYKPTLRAWYDRLVAHREQALNLVGLETYNRYMTFFPISWLFFEQNEAKLHRVVMEKSVA
ncbi:MULTISPECIES: class I SAM-dependent methyltransferase [unclassified Leptolyngbya]|uniref:class I SAM-dependent methyltransferase n=1 Tax=unclassified Leptolyngbya TaxID=2650499 RepID=UPI001682A55D|nr:MULTISPECIES: class I SAM-dependent methyltransferase [unclassified Leptolyngbya]MBD1909132.1 class I SAM-dependent methyltransferase [Leptolyngbya sp. FACHB-8]MBD2157506.1 class I SAM-dependent methyltransferase [Leptolyngbya sp. FACHB-16]